MGLSELASWCLGAIPRYNTVAIVSIKNPKLSLLHMMLQLGIMLYIFVFAIGMKKGYQQFAPVDGSTTMKVKGSAYNSGGIPWLKNASDGTPPYVPENYAQIFDSTDLVYPATEREAVFISTNMWVTPNQTRTTCYPGSDEWFNFQLPSATAEAQCSALCVRGTLKNEADTTSGGVWTGGWTLKPDEKTGLQNCYCELYTWCPDEFVNPPKGPGAFTLTGVDGWTVSVRQNIEFDQFNVLADNLPKGQNPEHSIPPIFTVRELLDMAGFEYNKIRLRGAVLVMTSDWTCDLDRGVDSCAPKVRVEPLSLSNGFNFRRVEFSEGMFSARQLIKLYGIRLIVIITGSAGKFDAAALFTNIGAGIGLLAVASLVADFAAVNLLGHKALYEAAKFQQVEVDDEAGKLRARRMSGTTEIVASAGPNGHLSRVGTVGPGGGMNTAAALGGAGVRGSVAPARMPSPGIGNDHAVEMQGIHGPSGAVHINQVQLNEEDEDEREESWARRPAKE